MNERIKVLIHKLIPDKVYLNILFKRAFNRYIDFKNPKTFNEKLQWLKIYDRKPIYTKLVDKVESKKVIEKLIGNEYIIKTLGVWDSFDEICFENLPKQFVLKCTHDSGSYKIIKDKEKIDYTNMKEFFDKSMKKNFYYSFREWPYKNVKPRIMAEQFMENKDGTPIKDYKIQCFNGKADNILVCVDRMSESGVKYHYFDRDWNYLPYCPYKGIDKSNVNVPKPDKLGLMIKIAEKIAKDFPQVRVDLYYIEGKIYFGEVTFYSQAGFDTDITSEADAIMGSKLNLK